VPNGDGRTGRSAAWGVAAAVFATGAFATWPVAVAPKSTFPIWPTYVFAVVAALALYMCFATIWGWWPTPRPVPGTDQLPSRATNLTKEYTRDKLALGFNSYALRTELAANKVKPDQYPYPTRHLAEFISTVNETFNISLAAPSGPIAPGDFESYFLQRMRPRDALGAALFRLGGDLGSWWQTKDNHNDEVDMAVEGNIKSALSELSQLRPHSSRYVQGVMRDYKNRDASTPDDQLTREFIDRIALAIISVDS
jgi:hypothetical protein